MPGGHGRFPTKAEMDRIRSEAIEFAGVGVYRYRFDGTVVSMDRGSLKLLDLADRYPDPSAVVGMDIGELFERVEPEGTIRSEVCARGALRDFEYRFRTLSGKDRWAHHSSYKVVDPDTGEELVQVIAKDITPLKEALLRLEASERRYRSLAESSAQGIFVLNEEMRVVFVNYAMAEITGRPVGELTGMDAGQLLSIIHPDDRQKVARLVGRRFEGGDPPRLREARVLLPSGEERWISSLIAVIAFEGRPALQATLTDITARKVASMRRLERSRREAQARKMASLGVMAGGVAHDFNNLLSVIIGSAQLAEIHVGDAEQGRRHLGKLMRAADQAAGLCEKLMEFAGEGEVEVGPMDLGRAVSESVELMRMAVARRIGLELEVGHGLPPVLGEVSSLRQILINLVTNAIKFTEQGGIDVVLAGSQPTPERARLSFTVTDTGIGMPPEVVDQLFSPFFQADSSSTRRHGGTGLGLALCKRLADMMNAKLAVASTPDAGSTFTLTLDLPLAQA